MELLILPVFPTQAQSDPILHGTLSPRHSHPSSSASPVVKVENGSPVGKTISSVYWIESSGVSLTAGFAQNSSPVGTFPRPSLFHLAVYR
jgi:hypothetical protein